MSDPETIGIVGAGGDLGSRMLVQACGTFERVFITDVKDSEDWVVSEIGVDPSLSTIDDSEPTVSEVNLSELIENSKTVHWCAAARRALDIEELPSDTMLVLHNSVMRGSLEVRKRLLKRPSITGKIAVAHCLVNPMKRVEIASDTPHADEAFDHFESLGLSPHIMRAREHDRAMAETQGLAAFIISYMNKDIKNVDALIRNGDITPSGGRFFEGLNSQDAIWTDETKNTILANPELAKLVWSLPLYWLKNKIKSPKS